MDVDKYFLLLLLLFSWFFLLLVCHFHCTVAALSTMKTVALLSLAALVQGTGLVCPPIHSPIVQCTNRPNSTGAQTKSTQALATPMPAAAQPRRTVSTGVGYKRVH